MVEQRSGAMGSSEVVSGNIEFYTLFTTLDITRTGDFSDNTQKDFESVVQVIGLRAQQLSLGCTPLIKVDAHIDNVIDIAEEEFKQKKIPFLIRRKIGNNYEYWKLEDLD